MTQQQDKYLGWRFTGLWLAVWVGCFVVTHTPRLGHGAAPFPQADKLIHVILYFMLTLLSGRALLARTGRLTRERIFQWAIVYAIYAVLDELLQIPVGRDSSVLDWLADFVGIVAATSILSGQTASQAEPPSDGQQHPGF